MTFSIRGIQEAQEKNLKRIAAMKPAGEFGKALQFALTAAHRYAVQITHVDTGALKGSHRMKLELLWRRGIIYIDPASPGKRGTPPVEYGVYEHRRGGSHAFYKRTVDEAGPRIAGQAGVMLRRVMR